MEKPEIQANTGKRRRNIFIKYLSLTALCVLLGLIDGFRSYVSAYHDGVFHVDLDVVLRWDVSGWLVWITFVPLVLRLSRRFPLDRKNWRFGLLVFLPAGLLLALARTFFRRSSTSFFPAG